MKIVAHKIEVTADMILNKREVEMIYFICSYGGIAKSAAKISGNYSEKEWDEFFSGMRKELGDFIQRVELARNQYGPPRAEIFEDRYANKPGQ